jgi:predicted nucleotidyltransferase
MHNVEWPALERVLAHTPPVVAAWVFGSAQGGQIQPGSDLDIGVLFEAKPSLDELIDLIGHLQQALQFETIDLVSLNEANPIRNYSAYQVTGT